MPPASCRRRSCLRNWRRAAAAWDGSDLQRWKDNGWRSERDEPEEWWRGSSGQWWKKVGDRWEKRNAPSWQSDGARRWHCKKRELVPAVVQAGREDQGHHRGDKPGGLLHPAALLDRGAAAEPQGCAGDVGRGADAQAREADLGVSRPGVRRPGGGRSRTLRTERHGDVGGGWAQA